jgi:ribonuclease HII
MYIGVDEVGRGALAGPLVVCTVLASDKKIEGDVVDSKLTTRKSRIQIWNKYSTKFKFSFGVVNNTEVDSLGMTKATELAISRALYSLSLTSKISNKKLVVDGRFKFDFNEVRSTECHIKGESKFKVVALASVFAKLYRDKIMKNYDTILPLYNFNSNVGYGSSFHINSIKVNSFSRIHRKLFLRKINEKITASRQL